MKLVYFSLLLLSIFLFPIVNVIPIGGIDLSEFSHNNELPFSPSSDNATIEVLVLHGATIIDGTGSTPKADTDIIISGNKIVAVTNQSGYIDNLYSNDFNRTQIRVSSLNLSGKYVMPGLFDMHAHVAGVLKDSYDPATSKKMLQMLLENGITTIRNPGGPTNESISLRQDVVEGKIAGPEIFTAGRLLNTPEFTIPFVERQVTTDEEVIDEVLRQALLGVDFIKLYVGLDPKLLKVAIDEAHRQGVKVIGHLHLTSWTEGSETWN